MANKDLSITLDEKDYQRLMGALEGLSNVDKTNAIAQGLKQGMQIIVRAGKSNLLSRNKKRTGNLLKSIGIRVMKSKRRSYSGFKRPKGAHAHLVSLGTARRWTKRGFYRGQVTGSHFWDDAVQANKQAAVNRLMDVIVNEMNRVTKRYNK